MTKFITDASQIQTRLDELLKEEELKSVELKKKVAELSASVSSLAETTKPVDPTSELVLICGSTNQKKYLKQTATFADFQQLVATSYRRIGENISAGYLTDLQRVVFIKDKTDLLLMFRYFFETKKETLQIVEIPAESVPKFQFGREPTTIEGLAVFLVEASGNENPLVFITFPAGTTKDVAMDKLLKTFGAYNEIVFEDEEGDLISLDSNEAWDYCLQTGFDLSKKGQYIVISITLK